MTTTFKGLLLASIAFVFSLSVMSQQVAKSIPNSTSPDGLIGFWEFRPPDYGTQKHPLIIFLHGAGEVGNGTSQLQMVAWNALPAQLTQPGVTMRFTANGQTSSFVVISPQLNPSYGYWPSFYVAEMIKYAKANLSIDPNRIYVTGLSLGGGGVWKLITDAKTLDPSFDSNIAAAAPICATAEQSDADFCRTVGANHLPIWAFHAVNDTRVSVQATQHCEQLSKNCGVTPASKFTYLADGDHAGAWTVAYDFGHISKTLADGTYFTFNQNLYEWFLTNSRSNTTPPPTNTPPTVTVGGTQTITLPVSTVTLTGTGTGTNGATISSYTWTQTSGPYVSTIVAPGSTTTAVTGLVQGSYVFTLTVKDNNGLSSSATVIINVNPAPANTPPTVTVGGAQTITLPVSTVTLSGTGTGTNGATISSYAWTQTSGPYVSTIVAPGSTTTAVTGLVQGSYVFTLTVKDNNGLSSSATVIINVNPAPANTPPTVTVGGPQTITLPTNGITLSGTGTAGNNGATISSYAWTQTSGPSTATIAAAASTSTSVTGLVQGVYVFTFTVKDNRGLSSSATVTVTVNPAPVYTPPLVTVGAGQTITLPVSSVTLTGTGTGTNGATISSYSWTQTNGPSIAVIVSPAASSTVVSGLVQGTYLFTFTAKDNNGLSANGTVSVTVSPVVTTGNQLPISDAGPAVTINSNTVTLDGSASYDPDGTIVQYYWSQVGGPAGVTITDKFGKTTTATGLVQGTYIFQLQVKDNVGVPAYSGKVVTVTTSTAANQMPVSNAGAAVTITSSTTTLDGSASYDPDGTITQYYWSQVGGPAGAVIADNLGKSTSVSGLVKGVYIFQLQVKDNAGGIGYSSRAITVNPGTGNQLPVANAGAAQTITLPSSTGTLDARASYDPDGTIVQYYWSQLSGPSSPAVADYFSSNTTVGPLVKGVYVFQLQVKDNSSGMAYTTKTITVNAASGAREAAGDASITTDAVQLESNAGLTVTGKLLGVYPNPVVNTATIELNTAQAEEKKISLYNATGVLVSSYRWITVKGRNTYVLKNMSGFAKGLYFIQITDSKGKQVGTLKLLKGQ